VNQGFSNPDSYSAEPPGRSRQTTFWPGGKPQAQVGATSSVKEKMRNLRLLGYQNQPRRLSNGG
jgi:hypothetical protein